MSSNNSNSRISVQFRGKTKYLKEDLIEWVKAKITDPNETLEQAIERLYIEGKEEQREQQQQVFIPTPNTMDFYITRPSHNQGML